MWSGPSMWTAAARDVADGELVQGEGVTGADVTDLVEAGEQFCISIGMEHLRYVEAEHIAAERQLADRAFIALLKSDPVLRCYVGIAPVLRS